MNAKWNLLPLSSALVISLQGTWAPSQHSIRNWYQWRIGQWRSSQKSLLLLRHLQKNCMILTGPTMSKHYGCCRERTLCFVSFMTEDCVPSNMAASATSTLFSKRPPFLPNRSATIPVMAPPIIPPTQKMATAMDQMTVTLDWSTTWPVLFCSVSVIHSSISWNRYEAQLPFPWGYTTQPSYTETEKGIFWYKKTHLNWTLKRRRRLEGMQQNKNVIYLRITWI